LREKDIGQSRGFIDPATCKKLRRRHCITTPYLKGKGEKESPREVRKGGTSGDLHKIETLLGEKKPSKRGMSTSGDREEGDKEARSETLPAQKKQQEEDQLDGGGQRCQEISHKGR